MKITKGRQPRPRKVLLYGPHGVGKSTWAAQAPSPIFLDCEDGANELDVDKTQVRSLEEMHGAISWLLNNPHDYRTVIIDTVDWLEQFMEKHIRQTVSSEKSLEYGGLDKKLMQTWKPLVDGLEQLRNHRRCGIVMLSHAKKTKVSPPDSDSYDRWEPDLEKSGVSVLSEWADEVFYADFRRFQRQEDVGFNKTRTLAIASGERYIRTRDSVTAICKRRIPLPDEMEMDWGVYASHVAAAYKGAAVLQDEKQVATVASVSDELSEMSERF